MTVGRVSNFTFGSGAKPKGKGPVKYAEGGSVLNDHDYDESWKDYRTYMDEYDAKMKESEDRMKIYNDRMKEYEDRRKGER